MTETSPEVDPVEPGDPDATDTGDEATVPDTEQAEHDPETGNDDADDDLADVPEGEG